MDVGTVVSEAPLSVRVRVSRSVYRLQLAGHDETDRRARAGARVAVEVARDARGLRIILSRIGHARIA